MEKHTDNVIDTLQAFTSKTKQNDDLAQQTELCSQTTLFCIQLSGDWLYQGSPLPTKFAKLFASILHGIDGEHFLITPVEKVRVEVDDAPLLIVDYMKDETASGLTLHSSIGTEHSLATLHHLKLTDFGIYLPLERGLWGKLSRACYYNFVNEFNLTDEGGLSA
ncbi:DUF1285 domain-containing protein [Shewanella xiamenensis]|uniref:DUF1285 domain-containing protein n=1 Tax=Shewanella xiamenensis TaxID=332186 RepID=UPI001C5026DE|nr:DUF1285 domain-containing protein [Shewanella xiamenensis]MBW0281784.1 hypothetical protein [Shewanella xiamenensis]MCT8874003.1 DUF1285 domain-containing protein [Shewanella xiamenensis]MDI5874247.1 DUF1285 domain-containing protein [Shewanella xiamenensis]UWH43836.1 DUF1285 domain-containing protein [Shewanella xiamenensis]